MRKILHISLSVILALSVFMLNFAGLVHCSAAMEDNCCHISKLVKPCCVKNLKITSGERISNHCGCDLKELAPTADLYHDYSNSSSNLNLKVVYNAPAIESGSCFKSASRIFTGYSPPPVDSKDVYLTNLAIRI
ncbi:MAG: hypothetical protein JNK43_11560 [Ignavibacteria bacterium]|nr:hypothetical protein [Ignavibacteria bacterium]